MLAIAKRANASKETLYSWFGSKEGLYEEVIEQRADASAERVRSALTTGGDPVETLTTYAAGLVTLLTSDASVSLNRAAMSSPPLAAILLASGRLRVGPIVETYLAQLHDDKVIDAPDAAAAFELFYGLAVRDTQIRVLLGDAPPTPKAINAAARRSVQQFFELTGR